jgi:amidase
MSVFTLEAAKGNPVTAETVDKLCSELGVTLKDTEKEEYRKLLAVFHDASQALLDMDGILRLTPVVWSSY